jgi:FdhD protein
VKNSEREIGAPYAHNPDVCHAAKQSMEPLMSSSTYEIPIERLQGTASTRSNDLLAVEEPLEIQLGYGPAADRKVKSIAVTMRTPGHDFELAVGFLMTEGVNRDAEDVKLVDYVSGDRVSESAPSARQQILPSQPSRNIVQVQLASYVEVSLAHLSRNFYTTSSCGICGKASLLALQTVCPPRTPNRFSISAEVLYSLPPVLRREQALFNSTGGLHGAALFDEEGKLIALREDVGRHNAVDKLVGAQFLQDRLPLRDALLLLSGRASFELLQKALMSGVSMVAAVGAPSSLAVQVARQFDVTLVGFLIDDHLNVYHGLEHVSGVSARKEKAL